MPAVPPRRRSGGPEWLRSITDRLTPTVKIFFTTIVLVYLFYVIVRQSRPFIEAHLVLGSQLFKGELWQLVTSLFFHVDFIGFLFGILGLWFIGPFIEGMHGRRRFLILFFGGGILGNLAMAIVYFLLLMKSPAMRAIVEKVGPVPFTDGCWLATTALFVAIGRLFGRQALQLWPLPLSFQARYLVGILIGFELAMALSRGDWPAVAGIIVAVGVGFFGAAPGGMTVIRSWYADARDRAKVRSLRRRFGVIDGGDRPPRKFVN